MKKVKLTKETIEPLMILGLISSENDIKLAWVLNNLLKIQFVRVSEETFLEKICTNQCAIYQAHEKNFLLSLIANKPLPKRPFEEFKKYDYILVVSGEKDEHFLNHIKSSLKKEACITAAFDISLKEIKKPDILEYF